MQYISAKEASAKWNISQRRVSVLCSEGRIAGASMVGNLWLIPQTAERPLDGRTVRNTKKSEVALKPFVKWAGGKGQLLEYIRSKYPSDLGDKITKYAEPFVGGGAVLFDVLSRNNMKEVYISDINRELIHTYISIRDNLDEIICSLQALERGYLSANEEKRKELYYVARERFNALKAEKSKSVELAALFIFLNRTCFNGLYRVNSRGAFNVPQGKYKNPTICDVQNLQAVSAKLQGVQIVCADYKQSKQFIDEHTLAYFDPPYRPLTATASFTSYTEQSFGDKEQAELACFIDELSGRGAFVIASNSDPKNVDDKDDFFDRLYAQHDITRVSASRNINSVVASRGKISELLISNHQTQKVGEFSMRNFADWLTTFIPSIANYGYYVDFGKVHRNVDNIKVELNILNSLIGSQNIESDFESLIAKYPETLRCIPLLLAVRGNEISAIDADGEFKYSFKNMNYPPAQYKVFMRETGLFDLLQNHIISNLVDYATGVETGLDSNGRKNRGGHLMEDVVEDYIVKAGFVKNVSYFKEMYIHQIHKNWGIDLSAISNQGKMEKRFDFVVKTENMIYVIETNFYGGGGSKLNETARSYKTLSSEVDTIEGLTFVWFTDGIGWKSARNNLEETFDVMEHIYNINDMKNGIITEVFK